jgi:hypothetical protein
MVGITMKKLLLVSALASLASLSLGQFFPLDSLVVVQTTTAAGGASRTAQTNLVGFNYDGTSNTKNFNLTAGGGITLTGNSSSEGVINGSTGFLAVGGYSVAADQASNAGVRRVAVFNNAGSGSVSFVDVASTGTAIRSAYTADGTNLLTSTSAGGWRTQTDTTPTTLGTTSTANTRVIKQIGSTIYGSTASGSGGFATTGTGIYSLTAGVQTLVQGTGSDAGTSDFEFIKDGAGLLQDYVLVAGSGGLKIYKGFQASSTPTNLLTTLNAGTAIQNVTVRNWDVNGLKKVTIFATSLTDIYSTTFDAGQIEAGGFGFTSIATAAAGTTFRGIEVVPEPASMAVLGIGLAGLAARRRRNK